MKIGDEVYVHGYVDEIRKDVIIIRNDGGYFGTVSNEMFYYEEDRNGYGTMNTADTPQTDCLTCRYNSDEWDSPKCDSCSKAHSNYEPQTDCPWK